MIAETPRVLLGILLGCTVLGGLMGFCLAQIIVKRRARALFNSLKEDMTAENEALRADLQEGRDGVDLLRSTIEAQEEAVSNATQRETALETHSQLQAQRIQSLESQVASYEDQQIRLQRDFASYKSNKSRELDVARNTTESWTESGKLPILSSRVDGSAGDAEQSARPPRYVKPATGQRGSASRRRDALSQPLSRELDIPTLAESELPDSVDDLDFDMTEKPPGSSSRRG
ncbi:MAG: hypothetical protein AB8B63_08905 [Granulosicoccus sp.]